MKPIVIRVLAASCAVVSSWPMAALADERPECEGASPSPHGPPMIVAAPPRDVTTYEERRPNANLIGSGTLMFGLAYGGSVVVGAASDYRADQHLFIPVVGPWMDIASRSCPEGAVCPNETANKVLLAADGLFQAAGVLQILGGFLFPEKVTTTRTASPSLRVTPSVGSKHLGMSGSGSF